MSAVSTDQHSAGHVDCWQFASMCRLFIWSPFVGVAAKNNSAPGLLIVCAVEDLSCALLPSIRSYTNFKLISSPSVHILSSASPSLESRKTGWGSVAAAALMTVTNVSQFCGKHFIDINCIQPRQSPQKFYAMLDTSQRQATAATAVSSCPQ